MGLCLCVCVNLCVSGSIPVAGDLLGRLWQPRGTGDANTGPQAHHLLCSLTHWQSAAHWRWLVGVGNSNLKELERKTRMMRETGTDKEKER